MTSRPLRLAVGTERLAVVRLPPDAAVPSAGATGGFWSATRTPDELSVVCDVGDAPAGAPVERGFRRITVEGPLDFALVGILRDLTAVLAAAKVSVFVLSTHDTDHVLVREDDLEAAVAALRDAGHAVGTA